MIKVSPILDENKAKSLFAAEGLAFAEGCAALVAVCGEDRLGHCLLQMTQRGVEILSIKCDVPDYSLIDWLMRSAMNYAANRGAYLAYCSLAEYEETLLSLSFEKKDGCYIGEVPEIFKGCKHCAAAREDENK